MRPLPLLLTTLLTIISLSPETQAQSKPTPAATAATSTKSIDQLVTKINADIKAKRVSKQAFQAVVDTRTQVRSFKQVTRVEFGPSSLEIFRRGQDIIKIHEQNEYEGGDTVGGATHYFRSDGSLAAFEIGYGVQDGNEIEVTEVIFYFDPTGKKIGEKATEKQGRKVKTFVLDAEQRKHHLKDIHFMNISQVAPYLSRRWKNN